MRVLRVTAEFLHARRAPGRFLLGACLPNPRLAQKNLEASRASLHSAAAVEGTPHPAQPTADERDCKACKTPLRSKSE